MVDNIKTEAPKVGTSKKGGRGTHGSTTKAGKVRKSTPYIPPSVKHKGLSPRLRNRRNFEKREVLKRNTGQNWLPER